MHPAALFHSGSLPTCVHRCTPSAAVAVSLQGLLESLSSAQAAASVAVPLSLPEISASYRTMRAPSLLAHDSLHQRLTYSALPAQPAPRPCRAEASSRHGRDGQGWSGSEVASRPAALKWTAPEPWMQHARILGWFGSGAEILSLGPSPAVNYNLEVEERAKPLADSASGLLAPSLEEFSTDPFQAVSSASRQNHP
ncbi:unnamed protein product [Natator depressus]